MPTRTKGLLAPCYKCEERELGCHGKCDKYKSFREEVRRRNHIDIQRSKGFHDWRKR